MAYNVTAPTTILSPLVDMNIATGNWFGGFVIMFVFMVTFFGLKMYDTKKAFLVASLISFIATVLLIPIGIVSPILLPVTLMLTLLGFFLPM